MKSVTTSALVAVRGKFFAKTLQVSYPVRTFWTATPPPKVAFVEGRRFLDSCGSLLSNLCSLLLSDFL